MKIITFSGLGDVASDIGSHLLYTLRIFLGVKEVRLPVKNMAKYWKSAREKRFLPVKIFMNLRL